MQNGFSRARFHGILSLLLVLSSFLIAFLVLFSRSIYAGIVYLFILLFIPLLIVFFYCTKCSCDAHDCAHYIPGKISEFLPDRTSENYKKTDFVILAILSLILFGFPQYWLWQDKVFFGLFWVLSITGFAEILFFICEKCKNEKCPLCGRNK